MPYHVRPEPDPEGDRRQREEAGSRCASHKGGQRRRYPEHEQRLFRHGFDGHIRTGVHTLGEAVVQSMHATEPSLVIVDDPNFNAPPRRVPVLVLTGGTSDAEAFRLIAVPDETNGLADEIARRLATEPKPALLRRRSPA